MAYTVTVQSVVDRAKTHADMKSSGFISDAEALAMFNECYAELYDELVGSFENYFVSESNTTIAPGTDTYNLPADFYKIVGVDFEVNSGTFITLRPFDESARNQSITTNNTIPSGTIRMRYIPAPRIYTALSQTMDGVAGWDRLVGLLMAMDMLDAEESDSSAIARKYARTLQRVRDMAAPRDTGMPATVGDLSRPNVQWIYGALRYRLYGDTIHLMSTEFLGSDGLISPFF